MSNPHTTWTSRRPAAGFAGATVHGTILETAATTPGAAIVDGNDGRTITFAELGQRVRTIAGALVELGIGPGDVILLDAPNSPEWLLTLLGAHAAGAAVTTASPLAPTADLARQVRDSMPRLVFTTAACTGAVAEALALAGVERPVLTLDGTGADSLAGLCASSTPAGTLADDPSAPAVILYSSGTTGRAKGVVTSHAALTAVADQVQAMPDLDRDSCFVVPLPFFHAGGLWSSIGPLAAGSTVVTMASFDLERYCQLIADHRATHSVVVPPMLLGLAHHPVVDRYDLSTLRYLACGAAPLGAELQKAATDRLRCPIGQAYGMTEAGLVTVADAADIRPGGAGRLTSGNDVIVVDPETNAVVGVDEVGELWVRGTGVMTGYLGRPEETAAAITDDGWLRTGDIVRIDRDGEVYVVDRLKELIKTNGFQVAPAELEDLLVTIDGVRDAAVVPRPHPRAGEVPVAYAVLSDGTDASAVMDAVARRVSPYKRLADIVVVDEIPKSQTGKILRRMLVERERSAVRTTSAG